MKTTVFIIAAILFFVEWYLIRKTTINKWFPLVVMFVIALPISILIGAHLVTFPLMMMLWALALCEAEDWLKKYLKSKSLTEMQRSKIKDL